MLWHAPLTLAIQYPLGMFWRSSEDPLYCDLGSLATTCTIRTIRTFAAGTVITGSGNLVVASTGQINAPLNMQSISIVMGGSVTLQTGATIRANLSQLTGSSITIESGATINASGLGGLGGQQPGNASNNGLGPSPGLRGSFSGQVGGGGGGHGGAGGDSSLPAYGGTGGAAIGSASNPTDYGSGGACEWSNNPGGNGGGYVKITSTGTVTINGSVSVNGNGSAWYGGGGSGGTLYIDAGTIAGTGALAANGGADGDFGSDGTGGSGGGGRIYVRANTFFAGTVTYGGGRGTDGQRGEKGSYYGVLISGSSNSICDSGDWATTCILTSNKAVPQNYLTLAGNNLDIQAGGGLTVSETSDWLSLTMSGDVDIVGAGAVISAPIGRLQAVNLTIGTTTVGQGSILGNLGGTNASTHPGLILSGNLVIPSGGTIDSLRDGYLGGYRERTSEENGSGPGGGVMYFQNYSGDNKSGGSGGAHGGAGGRSNQTASVATVAYDDLINPTDFGSGGGSGGNSNSAGGAGGGMIRAAITGTIDLNGILSSGGGNGSSGGWYNGGGGAGGTINLQAASISGSGTIRANGGNGASDFGMSGGGGGGGRISIRMLGGSVFGGTKQVNGGTANTGTGAANGAVGTIHEGYDSAYCDTGSRATTCTVSSTRLYANGSTIAGAGSLVVASGGIIRNATPTETISIAMTGDVTVASGGTINANLSSLTAANLTVETGAFITATGLGHRGGLADGNASRNGEGTGGGVSVLNSGWYGGGGGHGGVGGDGNTAGANGGASYGSATDPDTFGSGGGAGSGDIGGNGGGKIRIAVTGTVTNNGNIVANGRSGNYVTNWAPGGGAGGSIKIVAATLAGSGTISAKGGNSRALSTFSSNYGGSGGGGRIYLQANNPFPGTVTRQAGMGWTQTASGTTGTYQLTLPSNDSVCDSGTWATTCTISTAKSLASNVLSFTGANLTITSTGRLNVPGRDDYLSLALTGTMSIDGEVNAQIGTLSVSTLDFTNSGKITGNIGGTDPIARPGILAGTMTMATGTRIYASEMGHAGGQSFDNASKSGRGPGAGLHDYTNSMGGGGGHGGAGGNGAAAGATGGGTYGESTDPNTWGSGGASSGGSANDYDGSEGGGIARIQVGGLLTLNGFIRSNGGAATAIQTFGGGGGAGGSIRVRAGSMAGTGGVTANGGAASGGVTYYGGGGGGGRVAILVDSGSFGGTKVANGGASGGGTATAGSAGTVHEDYSYDNDYVYTTNDSTANLSGFSVNPSTGALTAATNSPYAAGTNPSMPAATPNGRYVYVPNYTSNTISAYSTSHTTGELTALSGSPYAGPAGTNAQMTVVHPTGNYLYASYVNGKIQAYSIHGATGALTELAGSPYTVTTGGAYQLAVTPNGKYLYVGDYSAGKLEGWSISATTGQLTRLTAGPWTTGSLVMAVTINPAGTYLFTGSNGGGSGGLHGFSLDDSTGTLTALGGAFPLNTSANVNMIAIHPAGGYLIEGDGSANLLRVYSIDSGTGQLTAVGTPIATAPIVQGVVFTKDGQYVYANGITNSSVYGYSFDSGTGALTALAGSPWSAAAAGYGLIVVGH